MRQNVGDSTWMDSERRRKHIIAAVSLYLAQESPGSISQTIDAGAADGIHVFVRTPQGVVGYAVVLVEGLPSDLAAHVYPALQARLHMSELYGIATSKAVIVLVDCELDWATQTGIVQQNMSIELRERLVIGVLVRTNESGEPPFKFIRLA